MQKYPLLSPPPVARSVRRIAAVLTCLAALCAAGFATAASAQGTIAEPSLDSKGKPGPDASLRTGATVLVLGDSISAAYGIQRSDGWVAMLADRLHANYPGSRVINASVSGETTGGGLARLPAALAADSIDVVVIELGGNDGLRGYPSATIEDNLRQMVELSQKAGAQALLFGMQIPPNYGPRYTNAFHQAFHDVAAETETKLLPFFLERVALDPTLMQRDGIHPTAEAQSLLLDTAWPLIDAALSTITGSGSLPEEPTLVSLTGDGVDDPSNAQSIESAP